MHLTERLLQGLAATQGDPHAQSAVIAEFTLETRPEAVREHLAAALDAAAVLRWFEAGLLARVLEIEPADAQTRFAILKSFPFVECYGGKDHGPRNLHENTRLGWRKKIAAERPARFRELSLRAAACFADDPSPAGRIEWIYQRLVGDPEAAAGELEHLDWDWGGKAHPEDYYALAARLGELVFTGLVAGRARLWCQIVLAWARHLRGETAQLGAVARELIELAQATGDQPALADAYCLRGDVLKAQGQLEPARMAYTEFQSISRCLVKQNPGHAAWQRELGVAHSRVGDVLSAQGQLEPARAAYAEDLAISRRLADQDPGHAGWQRELGVALGKVGDVLLAQGRLEPARVVYAEALSIARRLVEQDPGHAGWQLELGVAHGKVGDVLLTQGNLEPACVAYAEALSIARLLAEQNPGHAAWQRELGVAHSRVGDVLLAQGQLEPARAAYAEDLAISRRLAERDPGNADWQWGRAVACVQNARSETEAGRITQARTLYEEALSILDRLGQVAPGFALWEQDRQGVAEELARFRAALLPGKPDSAA